MGGSRPWTLGRAASLAAVVLVVIGVLTGLTHIGSAVGISSCNGDWQVVVGQAADSADAATLNSRAGSLVATPCSGAEKDVHGRYFAIATFPSQPTAQAYADALVQAGYTKLYGVKPYVRPAPTTLTPGR